MARGVGKRSSHARWSAVLGAVSVCVSAKAMSVSELRLNARRVALVLLGVVALMLALPVGAALAQNNQSYTYDALGRLTTVTKNGSVTTYSYDPAGNRTAVVTQVAPSAAPVSLTIAYNTAGSVALAPSGTYTSVAIATNPSHGSASISGTNATYTPTSGYYGSDSFTYTATGPGGTSSPATVSVTVSNPVAPTAGPVSVTVGYNSQSNAVALAPQGSFTLLSVVSGPSHGSASISGTNAIYTPTSGYYGSDSFSYTATGPGGTSGPATVSVTVNNPAAPTAGPASATVGYNSQSNAVALAPQGNFTSLSVVSGPSHGSASISGNYAIYTPTSGYYGSDSFTYTATGPGGTSGAATVSVTVGNPPAPTAGAVSATVGYNSQGNSVALAPQGVSSSLSIVSGPAHGSASISGNYAIYTPASGYYGSDSFTYTATGPGGTSAAATVSVTVGNPPAPTAGAVSATVGYSTSNDLVPLAPQGVFTSLSVASGPSHGSASISGTNGNYATYTPTSGYYGSDSFTYTATGPGGTSSPGTVTVTVNPPPAPIVVSANMTVAYGGTGSLNVTPYGVFNSMAIVSGASHGSASISGTTATYSSSGYVGSDSFTYTATGPGGTSSPATINVTIVAPPAPTVGNPSMTVSENTSGSMTVYVGGGPFNSMSIASAPANGSASASGNTASGGTVTYTPNAGFIGNDSFTYIASGPGGNSAPGTISVVVNGQVQVTATGYYDYKAVGQLEQTSGPATCTATGGTGSYSYSWVQITQAANYTVSANSPHSASTTFGEVPGTPGNSSTTTWQCVVTDGSNPPGLSQIITVALSNAEKSGQ